MRPQPCPAETRTCALVELAVGGSAHAQLRLVPHCLLQVITGDLVVLARPLACLVVKPDREAFMECCPLLLMHRLVGDVAEEEMVEAKRVVGRELGAFGLDQLFHDKRGQLGFDPRTFGFRRRNSTALRWKI